MLHFIFGADGASGTAAIIISVAAMLLCGFLLTRVTKMLHLPAVTAYIVTGMLIGPRALGLVSAEVIEGMDFFSDIALSFIAFSTGRFFRFSALKKNGGKVVIITLFEALLSMAAVFLLTYGILRLELSFSLVLSSLAAATSSASTVMTVRQTGARGEFVDTLLQLIAVDNLVALLAYSVAISIAGTLISGEAPQAESILAPLITNLGAMLLGGLFGLLSKWFISAKRSNDNRLIIIIAMLFGFCGICALLDISPLLGCMSMGMVYINVSDDDRLFKQVNYFTPPILLLYFVRSGASFDMGALFSPAEGSVGAVPLIVIGLLYFAVRLIGKYGGAFLGCLAMKKPKSVRNYLGFALVPQAGVAIGLSALGARALGGEMGEALETIVLAACILYELIGPAAAKASLYLSGSIGALEEIAPVDEAGKSPLDVLIARIQKIQDELPHHTHDEDEAAFEEAAADQYAPTIPPPGARDRRGRFFRH